MVKCIFWYWWARGVYGNVSRTLQTRKTTKNCTTFRRIHYNRDLYTKWTPAAPRKSGFILTLSESCTENDLQQKVLRAESWALERSMLCAATSFLAVFKRPEHSGRPVDSLAWCSILGWICPEPLYCVTWAASRSAFWKFVDVCRALLSEVQLFENTSAELCGS